MAKKHFSLKETARDFIALGSPVFFILVIARISFLSHYEYLSQFAIAGILFLILFFLFNANMHSGLGFIVLTFTTLYYDDLKFSVFAFFIYIGLIASLIYLEREEREIFLGTFLGIASTISGYLAVRILFG